MNIKNYNLIDLKCKIDSDLQKQTISGRVLLDRFCMIDETSRKSPSYTDPNYAGFYYHFGKYIEPNSIFEFGFDLGLFPASFMISCKTVQRFLGFREKDGDFFSERIGARNIKKSFKGKSDYYHGTIYDKKFDKFLMNSWDMIIFATEYKYDKQLEYLDFIWPHVSDYGIIVCDNLNRHSPTKEAFNAFAQSKNREPILFSTRHGTGLLQK